MSNASEPQCFPPFLDLSKYATDGGYARGRLCASIGNPTGQLQCCLPCPMTDWVYLDNFYSLTRIPGFIAIVSFMLCVFLVLSFAVLPPEKTKRHYLNICLIISIAMFELGVMIPVLARPPRCHDEITPNNNTSSTTCALAGGFLVAGGVGMGMWTFVRALSMHLLICWNTLPSRTSDIAMHMFAWGTTAVLVAVCMTFSGVSNRFGDYCLVNHYKSLETVWGPMLAVAAITASLQIATFIYCLHVYLKNLRATKSPDTQATFAGNAHHQTARIVYQRIKKVVQLQWLSLVIVCIMLVYVIFWSVVFVVLDNQSTKATHDESKLLPWIACLYASGGDKSECLHLASRFTVRESTLLAILVMFSIIGIQAFLLVGRREMISGWMDVGRKLIGRGGDSGPFEVGQIGEQRPPPARLGDKRTFEMVRVGGSATGGARLVAVETGGKRESVVSQRANLEDESHMWVVHGYDHEDYDDVKTGYTHDDHARLKGGSRGKESTESLESGSERGRSSYGSLSSPPVRESFASTVVDRGWRV